MKAKKHVPTSPDAAPGLGQRAARGGVIVMVAQASRLGLLLVSLAVLGRLLTPAEFGIFAFALAVVGVAELLRDFGLSSSAISAQSLTQAEKSNLFWMNTTLGLTLGVIIAASGVTIVALRPESSVALAMIGLSGVYLLNGIQTQFQVELTRALRFTALATTDILSQTLGLAIGIAAAVLGFGYWSLVAMHISISMILLAGRAAVSGWRPGAPQFDVPMRHHLQYGWDSGVSQVLSYLSINAPIYALGAFAGARGVGIFSRAAQVVNVPMNQVFAPLTSVALPSLSRVYGQDGFRRHTRDLCNLVTLTGAASFTVLFAIAPWFTPLVLGPAWEDSTPVLQWLCVGAVFQSATFPFFWVFLASRRTRALLHYTLVSKPASMLIVGVGAVLGGSTGAAAALALGFVIAWPLCVAWLRSDDQFDAGVVFLDQFRIIVSGAAGMVTALVSYRFIGDGAVESVVALAGALGTALVVGGISGVRRSLHRSVSVVARVRTT